MVSIGRDTELGATVSRLWASNYFVDDIVEHCDISLHVTSHDLQFVRIGVPLQFCYCEFAVCGVISVGSFHCLECEYMDCVSHRQC